MTANLNYINVLYVVIDIIRQKALGVISKNARKDIVPQEDSKIKLNLLIIQLQVSNKTVNMFESTRYSL